MGIIKHYGHCNRHSFRGVQDCHDYACVMARFQHGFETLLMYGLCLRLS